MKIPTLKTWLEVSTRIRDTLHAVMDAEEAARKAGNETLTKYWQDHWCRLYDGAEEHAEFHGAIV